MHIFTSFLHRIVFILGSMLILFTFSLIILFHLFTSTSVIIPYAINPFDICIKNPMLWKNLKLLYVIISSMSYLIITNSIYTFISKKNFKMRKYPKIKSPSNLEKTSQDSLKIHVGKNLNEKDIYIEESGLYQNILITGTIGSGKTSSAMYPFTKQLLYYKAKYSDEKLCMLILDVKGNYLKHVEKFAHSCNRSNDIITIDANGSFKYNPLDKPNLKASVLANRLKTIMTLFSQNNGESYWLDKTEAVLTECIKFCRLYNDNYVTFVEIHKLVTEPNYFSEKLSTVKKLFQSGNLSRRRHI